MASNIYQMVTDRIIEQMNAGIVPWHQPWVGSAMICNRLGIEHEKAFKNSAAYIQSWLKALKNDNKMIVWASARAEEAARYILGEKGE